MGREIYFMEVIFILWNIAAFSMTFTRDWCWFVEELFVNFFNGISGL